MTQQEEQLLNGLIDRVNGTPLANKDDAAEALLRRTLGTNPDALYILCQTVLVQGFAMDKAQRDLTAARAEIESLQQQVAQPEEKHGSFLGNLFGLGDDASRQAPPPQASNAAPSYSNPTGYGAAVARPSAAPGYAPVANAPAPQGYPEPYGYPPQPGYPPQAGYGQQPGYPPQAGYGSYAQPGYGAPPMGGGMFGGGGGFLQGAMQTAAGVVAGEFAFRAIEDMFHGSGGRGFEGGNETVNNYYDGDRPAEHDGGFGDRLAQADGYDGGISPDIEDRRGESRGFFGGADSNDTSNFAGDNSGGFDDSSSLDDGGSDGGDFGSDDN